MQQSGASTHRVPGQKAMERGSRFRSDVSALMAERAIYSDADLAARAGISANTLRNWWQGKAPEVGSLIAVADVLDQPLSRMFDLWQGRTPPEPEPSIATAIQALAAELLAWRTEEEVRLVALERYAQGVAADDSDDPKRPEGGESPEPHVPRMRAG